MSFLVEFYLFLQLRDFVICNGVVFCGLVEFARANSSLHSFEQFFRLLAVVEGEGALGDDDEFVLVVSEFRVELVQLIEP